MMYPIKLFVDVDASRIGRKAELRSTIIARIAVERVKPDKTRNGLSIIILARRNISKVANNTICASADTCNPPIAAPLANPNEKSIKTKAFVSRSDGSL